MKLAIASVAALCLASRVVAADPAPPAETASPGLTLSYFYDGGAVPFVWGAVGARLVLRNYKAKTSWGVPEYAVTGLGIGLGAAMLAGGGDARWYHVKGLTESLLTSSVVTGGFAAFADGNTERRSLLSGQSTGAFAIASYGILYLRGHVFDSRRGNSALPWWEAATYAGIGVAATAVAGERVYRQKESLAEVVLGGLLGTTSSTLFYLYQEKRYKNGKQKEGLDSLRLKPEVTSTSATLGISGVW